MLACLMTSAFGLFSIRVFSSLFATSMLSRRDEFAYTVPAAAVGAVFAMLFAAKSIGVVRAGCCALIAVLLSVGGCAVSPDPSPPSLTRLGSALDDLHIPKDYEQVSRTRSGGNCYDACPTVRASFCTNLDADPVVSWFAQELRDDGYTVHPSEGGVDTSPRVTRMDISVEVGDGGFSAATCARGQTRVVVTVQGYDG